MRIRISRDLQSLQGRLLDRFSESATVGGPVAHAGLEELLNEIVNELYARVRESSGGEDAVLDEYLADLENDIDGVKARRCRLHGGSCSDWPCQQSVGDQMSQQKGDNSVFANVIVDEAARQTHWICSFRRRSPSDASFWWVTTASCRTSWSRMLRAS
jgi:hypothetical protein